jgi:cation diffusion facilitator family transporter
MAEEARMSTEGGTRAVVAAGIANLGIATTKFVAFLITGSSSMLSEAIHSLADTGNQLLLLLGGKRAKAAPDQLHQFGYGRRRYIYSFIVAIMLFLLGGVFSLYEGFHKITHPEELNKVWVAYLVLFASIALESWSFKTAFGEASKSKGDRTLMQYIRDARQPELPVVLLEDTGALIGLVLAVFGITTAVVTGNPKWDGVGALAIGTLLLIIAVFLAFEVAGLLVGESALPEQEAAIRAAVVSGPVFDRIIHMRTLHTGPDELLVGVKVAVAPHLTAEQLSEAVDGAENAIREVVPTARWIYVEADIDRGGNSDLFDQSGQADASAPDGH